MLYQLPAVERDATVCPVCERELPNHHKLMKHMGVHHGEKYPCRKCGKILASQCMLQAHQPACIQGRSIQCPDCGKHYASRQSMRQHHKVAHGVDRPEADEAFPCHPLPEELQCPQVYERAQLCVLQQSCQEGALLLQGPQLCEGGPPLQLGSKI